MFDGWEIDLELCEVDLEVEFDVDGELMWIWGWVDWVDWYLVFGFRIFDYKILDLLKLLN